MFMRAVAVEYLQTGVPRTEIAMKTGTHTQVPVPMTKKR